MSKESVLAVSPLNMILRSYAGSAQDMLVGMRDVIEYNEKSWHPPRKPSQKARRRLYRQAISSQGRNKLSTASKRRRLSNKQSR